VVIVGQELVIQAFPERKPRANTAWTFVSKFKRL